ncbi:MAG: YciI family protein [Acidobacteriota bacterium]|nr:YciI family protein [Acidobacteriota bacterium]
MTRIAMHLMALVLAAGGTASAQFPQPAGMQTFYIYFLNKGPNYGAGSADEQKEIQAKHMGHLNSLGAAGKIAGPFGTDGPRRGLVILTAGSLADARAIGEADPAVKAGVFTVEIYTLVVPRNWFEFGPVPEPFKMRRFVFFFLDDAPGRPSADDAAMAKLQDGHLAHLYRLSRAGQLHLAGSLTDGGLHRGIGVMATENVEEAQQWMADDPMIKGGYLVVVPLRWFAADGILLRK